MGYDFMNKPECRRFSSFFKYSLHRRRRRKCPLLRNKFYTFILLNVLVAMVILVFCMSKSNHTLEFGSRAAYNKSNNRLTPRSFFVDFTESKWTILGGFRGTLFDDIGYLRKFAENKDLTKKIILRVGDYNFDDLSWKDGSEHLEKMNCPVTNCHFTSNRSYSTIADALVISEFYENDLTVFSPKSSHQIWVAQHLESPFHNRLNPRLLNGLVNWTATYRLDSTISLPYGSWLALDENSTVKNYAEGKTRKVAMFVSNCYDQNGRLNYARELNNSIEVHIYGGCGDRICPEDDSDDRSVCFEMLSKDYKFYLSFENSNCLGYITEKLHLNALSNDVVPIVMGARPEDYAVTATPGSYIHVDDFESPAELGTYLNLLDKNDTLYNEYFRFKHHFKLMAHGDFPDMYWCQLCAMLHLKEHINGSHWYDDYEQWWNGGCYARDDEKYEWKTWKNATHG